MPTIPPATIPPNIPGIDELLVKLSALIGGTITRAELPENVRGVTFPEGRIVEFAIGIDCSSTDKLQSSIVKLHRLGDALTAAAVK